MSKQYEIKTVLDIIKAVDANNVDFFLTDLKNILLHTSLIKAANNGSIEGLSMDSFTWIDDRKNNLDFEVKATDGSSSLNVKITDNQLDDTNVAESK